MSRHIEVAKQVVELTLKERRRWLHAYSFHLALDDDATRKIIAAEQAYQAALSALADEEARFASAVAEMRPVSGAKTAAAG